MTLEPKSEPKIELILYVSSTSPASIRAVRNLERLLHDYDRSAISLVIRDLAKDPIGDEDDDRITFTPTLVKLRPLPRTWIIGDLETTKFVADLLAYAGVMRKE